MLQIPVKEGESIERALKKYKKKFERTGVLKELRARKENTKKSIEEAFSKQLTAADLFCM